MSRLLPALILSLNLATPAAPAEDPRAPRFAVDPAKAPADWVLRPSAVLDPAASIAAWDLPQGFRAEPVAAEPIIQDPIAVAFAPDGRIYAIEYPGYNWEYRAQLGLPDEPAPPCRIVVLTDTDDDGQMDARSIFADGLDNARALALVGDGVLVGMPPELRFYRDTTGDGLADEHLVVVDDYGPIATVHAQPSGLYPALDNWIYSARYHARFRLRDGAWQRDGPLPSRGQWGMSQDDAGRLFYNTQADPLRADLLPITFALSNSHLPSPPGIDVRIAHDLAGTSPHAPTPGVNQRWGGFLAPDGTLAHFTSACSPAIFRGTRFPPALIGDAFVCVPAGNLVRHYALTRHPDGTIDAANAWPDQEFLFSHDERFRPVQALSGPGGALYIVDMHRGIIEGHTWITDITRDYILARHLHQPFNGLGRIYRITHQDHPPTPEPLLSTLDPAAWADALRSPDGWRRDAAQRLLTAHTPAHTTLEALRALALGHTSTPLARIHALWALEGLDALDAALLAHALSDPAPLVREHALQLAPPFLADPILLDAALALANDPTIPVLRQLLLTLGTSEHQKATTTTRQIVLDHPDTPLFPEAALTGLHRRELAFLQPLLADPGFLAKPASFSTLLKLLSQAIANHGDPALLVQFVALLQAAPPTAHQPLLDGLAAGDHNKVAAATGAVRALLELEDPALRAAATALVAALKPTPATPGIDPDTLDEPVRSLYQRGQAGALLCAACHQLDWKGAEGVAPPLLGSPWLEKDPAAMARIALHGYQDREDLPPMAPLIGLADDHLAAILTYLRFTLAQRPSPVLPETITKIRAIPHDPNTPWTPQSLEASLPAP